MSLYIGTWETVLALWNKSEDRCLCIVLTEMSLYIGMWGDSVSLVEQD